MVAVELGCWAGHPVAGVWPLRQAPADMAQYLMLTASHQTAPTLAYQPSALSLVQEQSTAVAAQTSGAIIGCTSEPPLPDGLVLASSSCDISGSPTAVQSVRSYSITASNAAGNSSANLAIEVTPKVAVVVTQVATTFSENGGSGSYTLRLNSQPDGNVVIDATSPDTTELLVSTDGGGTSFATRTITFNSANWSTAQTITLVGQDDAIADLNQAVTVTNLINAGLTTDTTGYASDSIDSVNATVMDDDTPIVTVVPGTTTFSEGGGTGSYSVVLNTQPNGNVVIDVATGDTSEALVSTDGGGSSFATRQLLFNAGNWNVAQTITVVGQDDALVDGAQPVTISNSANAGLTTDTTGYDFVAVNNVAVTVQDDDVPPPATLTATGGDSQITLTFPGVVGAVSYNIYFGTSAGVTIGGGTQIAGVTSPYVHTGRTLGTDYYYIVTAVGAGGESTASTEATSFAYRYPLRTYLTTCWDNGGSAIGCAGSGQDGEYQFGRAVNMTGPTQHATYTSDYTTTDNVTGLVWKTCPEGVSGAACAAGGASTGAWSLTACDSLNVANSGAGYAGRTDWSMPTAREIETIVQYSQTNPTIFTSHFPGSQGGITWTATVDVGDSLQAWYLSFGDGSSWRRAKTTSYGSRCVAGAPYVQINAFVNNGDGTVTDKATGLMWARCSYGQTPPNCADGASSTSPDPLLSYCNGSTLAGHSDWRLANISELATIFDRAVGTPPVNTTFFPNPALAYWSSTVYLAATSQNYFTQYGNDPRLNRHTKGAVGRSGRCVRTLP